MNFDVLFLNLARGYQFSPEQVGRMTLAQACMLSEALVPDDEKAGGKAGGPEIRSQADLDALLDAARRGEVEF